MKKADLLYARLTNQQIAKTTFTKPEEIVTHLGAMQAQEYAMAKWAIGLRLQDTSDSAMETAFNSGKVLRTHLLRPTWHFVSPADIRWMIMLTAPRVKAINAFMYRKCELDAKTFQICNDIIIAQLEGRKNLTRNALKVELDKKIQTGDGVRLSCIMMQAELDGIICSGPREGKQFTYALIEERVPKTAILGQDEALAELTKRYFTSRSPALLEDFVMWSGLTVKDAKKGISMLSAEFSEIEIDRKKYITGPIDEIFNPKIQSTFLMPDYDEYGMSYKDRSAIFDPAHKIANPKLNIPFNRMIVVDGEIVGCWKRTIKKEIEIELEFFKKITKKQEQAVKVAVKKFCSFACQNYTEQ